MIRTILVSIDGLAAYYFHEGVARIPCLRALAARGALAARMETVFPSTTWPSHVSLVTGVAPARHGVVSNSILNRASGAPEDLTGDPIYDAGDLLRAPTVYDRAHAAGLRAAAVDWPATRRAGSLAFNLPFFKNQRIFESVTERRVWEELSALGYPMDRQGEWAQQPKRFLKDAMVADVAAHVWHRHAPELLLVHFLCVDSHQHLWGPRSPEAYWALEYVDGLLARFLATLPANELAERTALLVVSDHGFLPVTREVRPNALLARLRLLEAEPDGRVARADVRFVMNHGAGWIYVLRGDRDAIARDVAREVGALEGVGRVFVPGDFGGLGLPARADHPHVGDLLLEAAEGYSLVDDAAGNEVSDRPRYRGTHGQRPHHAELGAFFVAVGPSVARGRVLPEIRSRDVAPTVAHLLGVDLGPVEGRRLDEIFG